MSSRLPMGVPTRNSAALRVCLSSALMARVYTAPLAPVSGPGSTLQLTFRQPIPRITSRISRSSGVGVPIYEYQCKKCGHRFERIQKFSDKPVTRCPECGGKVEQLLHAPAVQFKGSGWYVTDYARKSSAGSSADGGSKPESKAETKSETKEEKKESKPKTEKKKS